MKVVLIYESIYGNTKLVADAIADGIREHADVEVYEVGSAPQPLGEHDLLVVGGPTQVWGMTRQKTRVRAAKQALARDESHVFCGKGLRQWLATAGRTAELGSIAHAATFETVMRGGKRFAMGSAAHQAGRILRGAGYAVAAPPQTFRVSDRDGPLVDGELARARAWGATLPQRLKSEPYCKPLLVRGARFAPPRFARPEHVEAAEIDTKRPSHLLNLGLILGTLFLVHSHVWWRPWFGGLISERWTGVVWAFDLSLALQLVATVVLLSSPVLAARPFIHRGAALLGSLGACLAAIVCYRVFPFDFSVLATSVSGRPELAFPFDYRPIANGVDLVVRLVLLLAIFGMAIAAVVNAIQLLASTWPTRQPDAFSRWAWLKGRARAAQANAIGP